MWVSLLSEFSLPWVSIPAGAFQALLLTSVSVASDGSALHGVDPGALGREFSQLGFRFISISGPETLSAFFVDPILNMVPVSSEALNTVLVLSDLDHIHHG
jgi:hypothetical protein